MSTRTPNYSLILPAQEDYYNVDDFNDNYSTIDEELKNNADGLDAVVDEMGAHKEDKSNPHSVTAQQVGLGTAAEDIAALKSAAPRGTQFIMLGADTPFTMGWGTSIKLGREIYVCQGRMVRVDILMGLDTAKECGLCLDGGTMLRSNSVVVCAGTQPQNNILLAVTDLGKCAAQDEEEAIQGLIINGLAAAGLYIEGYTPWQE